MIVRIIVGVLAGFVAWMLIWVGSERVLSMLSPDWFGVHQTAFERAVINTEPYTVPTTIAITNLIRGLVVTLITGFIGALIARESRITPVILGPALILVSFYIAFVTWWMLPAWYHVLFVLMLIPMSILGARLRGPGVSVAA